MSASTSSERCVAAASHTLLPVPFPLSDLGSLDGRLLSHAAPQGWVGGGGAEHGDDGQRDSVSFSHPDSALIFFNGRFLMHAKVLRDDGEIDPIPAALTADASDLVVLAER